MGSSGSTSKRQRGIGGDGVGGYHHEVLLPPSKDAAKGASGVEALSGAEAQFVFQFPFAALGQGSKEPARGGVLGVSSATSFLMNPPYINIPLLVSLGHHGGRRKVASLRPPFSTPLRSLGEPGPESPFLVLIEHAPPLFVRVREDKISLKIPPPPASSSLSAHGSYHGRHAAKHNPSCERAW
jgi:hypothetical protein